MTISLCVYSVQYVCAYFCLSVCLCVLYLCVYVYVYVYAYVCVSFTEVMQLLNKIPLLPCLTVDSSANQTLLSWINAQDRRNSLEQMVQQCQAARKQVSP